LVHTTSRTSFVLLRKFGITSKLLRMLWGFSSSYKVLTTWLSACWISRNGWRCSA
jgi:hypothetical protein